MDTLQPHSFKGMNETVAEMIAVDIAREQNVGMDEAKEMANADDAGYSRYHVCADK